MPTLNKVMLIGNLTRDPELRKTPAGKTVVSFGLATNRNWIQENGEKREETDFHRIVAWGKLGELCEKFLKKGRLVYVEGRLHSHSWTDNEGMQKAVTEIIADAVEFLDSNKKTSHDTEKAEQTNGRASATGHQ
jgi:single-strand DNA-binding protein